MKWRPPWKRMAPYSPRLMMSVEGPIAMIFAAARRRLCSPESKRASLSLINRKSHCASVCRRAGRKSLIQ